MPFSTATYLLELPNEAIQPVLEYLSPADAVNFASTCRQICRLEASDTIQKHRGLQTKYTHLKFSGCHFHGTSMRERPLTLLIAVVAEPSIRYYARSLTVETCFDVVEDADTWQIGVVRDLWKERREEILDLMLPVERACFGEWDWPEIDENSDFDVLEDTYRRGLLGALLTILSNLELITFTGHPCCDDRYPTKDRLDAIVRRIALSHLNPDDPAPKPLSKLKELNLANANASWVREGETNDDVWVFASFGLLPAMRTFSGANYASHDLYHNQIWPTECHKSLVRKIDLQRSALGSDCLRQLLHGISDLESFTYDSAYIVHGGGMNTFNSVLEALLEHAASSLEYLALTSKVGPDRINGEKDTARRTLVDFQVLKNATLPARVYLEDIKSNKCPHPKVELDTEEREALQLVDILPASIETIQLDGRTNIGAVVYMLLDLPERKAECFPNLTRIHFTQVEPEPKVFGTEVSGNWGRVWIEKCRKVGVELVL